MSVAYNWRRGAKANKPRPSRKCFAANCTRVGTIGNYCSDHASRPAAEGPIGRMFRLRHQANQQREDALLPTTCRYKRTAYQFGIKLSAAQKARNQRVAKHILIEGFSRLFNFAKKAGKVANPWAR